MKEHLYIILLALLPTSYANTNCTFTKCTDGGLQTPAQKQACGITISVGLTRLEKCRIVRQHNALRSYVAAGLEKREDPGPQPAALNMKTIRWDSRLACMAQTWANNCKYAYDPSRKDDIVQLWYDEVSKLNKNQVQRLTNVRGVVDYTQLIWAATDKLGCGKIVYQAPDNYKHYYLVCNYGPGGNVMTRPLYDTEH